MPHPITETREYLRTRPRLAASLIFAAALIALLAVALALTYRASFSHAVILVSAGLFLIAPLALVSVIISLVGLAARRRIAPIALLIFAVAVYTGIALVGSYAAGRVIGRHDFRDAREYALRIAHAAEQEKKKTGRYPADAIALIQQLGPPPHLLRGRTFYHSDGARFSLHIIDPRSMLGSWHYDNTTRRWEYD